MWVVPQRKNGSVGGFGKEWINTQIHRHNYACEKKRQEILCGNGSFRGMGVYGLALFFKSSLNF